MKYPWKVLEETWSVSNPNCQLLRLRLASVMCIKWVTSILNIEPNTPEHFLATLYSRALVAHTVLRNMHAIAAHTYWIVTLTCSLSLPIICCIHYVLCYMFCCSPLPGHSHSYTHVLILSSWLKLYREVHKRAFIGTHFPDNEQWMTNVVITIQSTALSEENVNYFGRGSAFKLV